MPVTRKVNCAAAGNQNVKAKLSPGKTHMRIFCVVGFRVEVPVSPPFCLKFVSSICARLRYIQ